MSDLSIKATSVYTWSAEVLVPLTEQSLRAIEIADAGIGVNYNPIADEFLQKKVSDLLDVHSDIFAAKAKKKGFERTSTGLTASVIGLHEEYSDGYTHAKIKLFLERAKGH